MSWKIIRSTDYKYVGIIEVRGENKLLFVNRRFVDEWVLVDRAKYVNVQSNTVEFLTADDESHLQETMARHVAN